MGLMIKDLRCRCGSTAFTVSERVVGCFVCGTALGTQFKVDETGALELDIDGMNKSYQAEPNQKYGSREEMLESIEMKQLTGMVIVPKGD